MRVNLIVVRYEMKNTVGQLRWLLVAVIAVDVTLTLIGQPSSYWHNPSTGVEGNPFFAWFLVRGPLFFVSTAVFYAAVAFLLSSLLPYRLALIVCLSFVFGHYCGASSWLLFRFNAGMAGPIIYGILISTAAVFLGLRTKQAERLDALDGSAPRGHSEPSVGRV
ncbi:MAG: hypothetical protein KBE65_12855 [Phycisphaerae bacterium]|nr:hypothetical protein [Phycisphaerae bacterium]